MQREQETKIRRGHDVLRSHMKRISLTALLILMVSSVILSNCGGGGGGGGGPQQRIDILTLATSVTGTIPAGTLINGYDVTVTLPSGATVKSTINPPETDPGVVTLSPEAAGSLVFSVYTAATSTIPGKIRILLANATGVNAGTFATVQCDIAAGSNPRTSDFSPFLFSVSGTDITNSSVDLTNQLSLTATMEIK